MSSLTVIVPTLNEEATLGRCLKSIRAEFSGRIRVTDGGSTDETRTVAERWDVEWVVGSRGLASQCNRAMAECEEESFFVVSADCRPAPGWKRVLDLALADPMVAAGGFRLAYPEADWRMALIAFGGNFRSRYVGMSLPDQGLFTRRAVFDAIGGFCPDSRIPFARYCLRAAELGSVRLLSHPMWASARDFEQRGRLKTVWNHAKAYWQFRREESLSSPTSPF